MHPISTNKDDMTTVVQYTINTEHPLKDNFARISQRNVRSSKYTRPNRRSSALIQLFADKPVHQYTQESPADAVKPARRKSMPKFLQFDVFRFISPNSISPNCQCIASRGRPIRCLPIIKFLVQIAST